MKKNEQEIKSLEAAIANLTDKELDEMLKDAMREAGYTTFINYQGEEEPL